MDTLIDSESVAPIDRGLESRSDARHRLLEAAMESFREEGYRVSIDRIAARAHVARQTVYNHFGSKDELFAEVIRQASQSVLVTLQSEGELRSVLHAFGQAYRERLLGADGIAIFRTLTAEAPHFPHLARQFFDVGPAATRARLADVLSMAMNRGELRRDHPHFAAEMLTAMLVDFDRLKALLTLEILPVDPRKTQGIVDCFLRAFAPIHTARGVGPHPPNHH